MNYFLTRVDRTPTIVLTRFIFFFVFKDCFHFLNQLIEIVFLIATNNRLICSSYIAEVPLNQRQKNLRFSLGPSYRSGTANEQSIRLASTKLTHQVIKEALGGYLNQMMWQILVGFSLRHRRERKREREREREREVCLFASTLFNKLPLETQKTIILHFEIKKTDNKPYISYQRAY